MFGSVLVVVLAFVPLVMAVSAPLDACFPLSPFVALFFLSFVSTVAAVVVNVVVVVVKRRGLVLVVVVFAESRFGKGCSSNSTYVFLAPNLWAPNQASEPPGSAGVLPWGSEGLFRYGQILDLHMFSDLIAEGSALDNDMTQEVVIGSSIIAAS